MAIEVNFTGSSDGRPVDSTEISKFGIPEELLGKSEEEFESEMNKLSETPIEPLEELNEEEIPEEMDGMFPERKSAEASPEVTAEPNLVETEKTVAQEKKPVVSQVASDTDPGVESLRAEVERDKAEASEKMRQAHESRLAGKIGHLEQQLRRMTEEGTEQYEPESQQGQAVAALQTELDSLKSEMVSDGVQRAASSAFEPVQRFVSQDPELSQLTKAELEQVIAPYLVHFQRARESKTPEDALRFSEAIALNIQADLKSLKLQRITSRGASIRAANAPGVQAMKQAASIESSSQSVRARPKTVSELSPDHQERLLDRMIRSGRI